MQLRLHWRNEAPLPSEGLWASRSLHSDRKLARLQWEICDCSQAALPWLWPSSKYGQLSGCWPCQQQIPSEMKQYVTIKQKPTKILFWLKLKTGRGRGSRRRSRTLKSQMKKVSFILQFDGTVKTTKVRWRRWVRARWRISGGFMGLVMFQGGWRGGVGVSLNVSSSSIFQFEGTVETNKATKAKKANCRTENACVLWLKERFMKDRYGSVKLEWSLGKLIKPKDRDTQICGSCPAKGNLVLATKGWISFWNSPKTCTYSYGGQLLQANVGLE